MEKRIIFISLFTFFTSVNSQWVLQNHPGEFRSYFDIQFVDQFTGWVVGDSNTILRTTNGGVEWLYQVNNLSYFKTLYGISMINSNTGFVVGANETILKTTTGGEPWFKISELPSFTGRINNDVYFFTAETGWISSGNGRILRTGSGGAMWDTISVGSNTPLNVIQFVDFSTGWIAGDAGYIRKTTNGGGNWSYLFYGTAGDFTYNSMHFLNSSTGWIASFRDIIFRTTDGGLSWDSLAQTYYSQSIRFADTSTGWCGGSEIFTNKAIISKTSDGGQTWGQQILPFASGFCTGIWSYSDSIAWAVYAFRIVHTTDGGGPIGITNNNEYIPNEFNLYQNYPNPFNSTTIIDYEIKEKGHYKLEVYDIRGRQVELLLNDNREPGVYSLKFRSVNLSSGIYFYALSNSCSRLTKKLVIVK